MLDRVLLKLLAWRRGSQVGAMKDLRQVREIQRFSLIFFATIVVPAILLSYFALASSRSEELTLDADLRGRAEVLTRQVVTELEETFWSFEHRVRIRVRDAKSAVTELEELSPYLRAAFQFDDSDSMVAPFGLLEPAPSRRVTPAFGRVFRMAQLLESDRKWDEALISFQVAEDLAQDPGLKGEARFSAARVAEKAGRPEEAERRYASVLRDFPGVRDERGFRLGDLSRLALAELAASRDPDLGSELLWDLAADLLAGQWIVGRPGEPAVARRALDQLDGHLEAEQLDRTRALLQAKSDRLHWAGLVADELELYRHRVASAEFRYEARPDSPAVWATVALRDDTYVYSFSAADLIGDLEDVVSRTIDIDGELSVLLRCGFPPGPCGEDVGSVTVQPEGQVAPLADRSLGPWLSYVSVVVLPVDPDALAAQKAQRRVARVAVISLAVLVVVVGVLLVANLLAREMQTARMKTDFAASVSHELRSPITQIRVKAESLWFDVVPPEEQREYYAAIVRESERLTRLVDNVLDFAAIERGAKKYHFRPDDLGSVLQEAVDANESSASENGCTIELDLPAHLPAVWIDREAIGQVLTNLISNALKYGADGGWIGVRASAVPGGVEFSVSDRGMGIPAAELPRVFDEFFRSSSAGVRRRKGTGIGLTIVRYIVEAHGGKVEVESKEGSGTTFTVSLPLTPPESPDDW